MYILSDQQYKTYVEPIVYKIFVNGDRYKECFQPHITHKVILYPCYEKIEITIVSALEKGASIVGDTGCYLSFPWEFGTGLSNCYIPLSELVEFYTCSSEQAKFMSNQLAYSPEYTLLSENGKWGLTVSHEYYGLLGGSFEFITTFKQNCLNLDQQVKEFLQNYCSFKDAGIAPTLDWLPKLLTYVYGQETAEQMLKEAKLLS